MKPSHRGRCALVTRPRAEADDLAAQLDRRGVEAIIEPLLEIHYRDEPIPDFAQLQAILCTSANGVRALARLTGERAVPLFAIGETSAARARDAGFARVESAGGSLADLAALIRERLRPDAGQLLHVAGSVVAGDLAGTLRANGFAVERAVLYEARPAAALSGPTVSALTEGIVDFALFFSPRTAAVFADLVNRADIAATMAEVAAISISAAADAALDRLSFRERNIAGRPDQSGLLLALDHALGERCRA